MSTVQNKSLIHDCIWVLPAVYARYVCTIIIARELLIVLKVFLLLVCKALALYVCFWGALLFILTNSSVQDKVGETNQYSFRVSLWITLHSHDSHMTSTPGVCRECSDRHGVWVPVHASPCSDCHDTSCAGNKWFGRFSSYQAQGSRLDTVQRR